MSPHRSVLTTGEVAKLCNVAPRTVSKWFDSGQLRGYRIPGSKDRRIPVDQLLRFMRVHGIPLNGLEAGMRRVLVVDGDAGVCAAISRVLSAERNYEVLTVGTAFEAGALAAEAKPHVAIFDVSLADIVPLTIIRWFKTQASYQATCLVAVVPGMTTGQSQGLMQQGFDACLSKPFEARALIGIINRHFPDESAG